MGGGLSYYRARKNLQKLIPKNDSEKAGIEAASRALETPLVQIIKTFSPPVSVTDIVAQLESSTSDAVGFNAETGKTQSLESAGIFDPAQTLKQALLFAFSHCKGILKTGAWDASATPAEGTGLS